MYEIWSVICFLNARNVKPADIHCQICEACGENAMHDGMVRKWVSGLESSMKVVIMCMTSHTAASHLWSQVAMFYKEGIQKPVPHYDKCLNNGGNYVEN
jgi:hypothetical protein